jgi:hypothetical protein
VEPIQIQQKARWDVLCLTWVFASGGICRSRSAFWCVQAGKCRCIFFMLGWDRYGFNKKHVGTCYTELVFLYPMGSTCHVVYFRCIRSTKCLHTIFQARVRLVRIPQKACWGMLRRTCVFASVGIYGSHSAFRCVRGVNIDALYAQVGTVRIPQNARRDTIRRMSILASGGICGSHSAIRCIPGMKRRRTIFYAQVGPLWFPEKARWDTLRRICVFASSGICGPHSAYRCVWGTKRRSAIFRVWVGPIWIEQKAHRDTLRRTCVFTSGGICGSRSAFQCVRGVKH